MSVILAVKRFLANGVEIPVDSNGDLNIPVTGGDGEGGGDPSSSDDMATQIQGATLQPIPLNASIFGYVNAGILVRATWSNIKSTLKTYFDTVYVSLSNLKEEKVIGTATENLNLTGNVNIDLSSASHRRFIVTGNTVITLTNMPEVGKSFTRTFSIDSSSNRTFGISNATKRYNLYIPNIPTNFVTIMCSNTETLGLEVHVFYSQANQL